jgi:hypothetical protein
MEGWLGWGIIRWALVMYVQFEPGHKGDELTQ